MNGRRKEGKQGVRERTKKLLYTGETVRELCADRRDRVHQPREPFHELFTFANIAGPAFPWKLIRVYRATVSGNSNSGGNRDDLIFHHTFIPCHSFFPPPPLPPHYFLIFLPHLSVSLFYARSLFIVQPIRSD